MIPYYGDFPEDHTAIRIPFNTFDSNDPSASVTITNLADADIKVHKDGSLTQIVTDGASIIIDFDGITGNHMVLIDSSVHADYSTGSEYAVRIEGTTVDVATINAWIGAFSIERAGGALAKIIALSTKQDSDMVVVVTAHTKTQSDILLGATVTALSALSTKQDSDMVVVANAHTKTQSDIVLSDGKADSDMVLLIADHDKTQSDIVLVTTDVASLSTKQDSDMVVVADAHTKTQSDIVLLSGKADSDMVLVIADHDKTQSDVADLSTKQDSDMVVIATAHTKTQSDVALAQADLDTLTGSISELSQAAPTATPTLMTAVMMLYMMARNKFVTQTSGADALEFYNNAGTKVFKKLITDDGSDYTENEMTSGA